jgi:hypothetical protein
VSRDGALRLAVPASIGLGPVLVLLALRLPLINQLDYADAWFYSAYAWAPRHHFGLFGWNYFSVRFPTILSIGTFERALGTHEGYVVLRYLLAVGSGAALYLGVRRFASVGIALATALLLYLDPFFSRMLLWDYTGFVAVSAGVIGFALWWWSEERGLAWTLLPGAALAIALFANALMGTALFVLFVVESVAALRLGRNASVRTAARFAIAVLAALATFVLGYLGYVAIIGSFGPGDLVRPTIEFLRSNSENSAPYRRPTSEWLLHELRIWPPVVVAVALVAVLGRRVLGTDVPARIAQACIGYTIFLWIYRFTVTSSVIETWWAYSLVVVVLAPASGVVLWGLAERWPTKRHAWLAPLAVVILAAVLLRNAPGLADDVYARIAKHQAALFGLLALGLVSAALLALRQRLVSSMALVVVFAVLTGMMWAPSVLDGRGTTGVFVTDAGTEWRAYSAARDLLQLIRNYDSPNSRVFTWYPGTTGLTNIGWATLPQDGTTVQLLGFDQSLAHLFPLGRARLLQPSAAYVLVMSPRASDLQAAQRSLSATGFKDRPVVRGSWAAGRLSYVLLALTRKPG